MERRPERPSRGWCSDCRAAAEPRCRREKHNVVCEKRELKRLLQGALQQAAEQLEHLPDLCEGEQDLQTLDLLNAESWSVTLQGGGHQMTGTVTNTDDPLSRLMWLLAKAALEKNQVEARDPRTATATLSLATPGQAPLEGRPVRKTRPTDRQQDKAPGVTRLVNVWCDKDPARSLRLLQRAAPTVERLRVRFPREDHLSVVHAMPRLRRLYVWGVDAPDAQPPELPALPAGRAGLQRLRVHYLPRATTQSLLRAHGGTLEELELQVGTAGSGRWPDCCGDLHSLLQQSGLRALRRLVLMRYCCSHEAAACSEQRARARQVLHGSEVLCDECDTVILEDN
ncbi:uncharacterized protein LOC113210855 isoform X2 [Frankliniella occidentalis]|nr:uncharacterized protein LOC113210855 isoform X2 [Frankliniella occidentalis]